MMSKVPKGEGKTRGRNGKTAKCAEEQNNESTYSFQNCDSRQVLMLLYQGRYLQKEKETSFLTLCMVNFGLTATSLFKIWTPAWSFASTSRFHKGSSLSFLDILILSLFWQIGTLSFFFEPFFFFFSSPTTFFRFWFSISKDFSLNKKLSRVNFVKCSM